MNMNLSFVKKIIEHRGLLAIAVVIVFIGGYATRGLMGSGIFPAATSNTDCVSNLEYINPQPGCEIYESKLQKMSTLEDLLNTQVDRYIKDGKASRIAVFSRDLRSQRFVGVHDSELFNMASLLKVLLVATYYRVADTAPDTLKEKITYSGVPDLYSEQAIQPTNKLVKGSEYTFHDLAFRSLVYSDNTAAQILLEHISDGYFDKVLGALGLQAVRYGEKEDLVNARSYGGVFRILYNSSFLSRESSNEIIKMLTQSAYTNGAVKKLPKDLVVAHKFGERSILDPITGVLQHRQLHDCGIVYGNNGKDPYTFCILTEGSDYSELESVIQDLSLTIYNGLKD